MFSDFDAIKIGDEASLVRDITLEDISRFVELTGDDNPLHVDAAFAEKTAYKDVVVHGMLGASFISTVIGTKLPGPGALWASQSFDFLKPVRLGDQITVVCTVKAKDKKQRRLTLETKILNQLKDVVLTGEGVVHVLETAAPEKSAGASTNIAIVTGGAGGMGRAICLRLAREGYSVAVNYSTSGDKADELVKLINKDTPGKAIAVKADISDLAGVEKLCLQTQRQLGAPSVVIHNASPPIKAQPLKDLDWDIVQQHMDVQLKAAVNLAKIVTPAMQDNTFGRLVFITSQVVEGTPPTGWTAYGVAKSAVTALSRFLAQELGPTGITVNCVAPGMTDTGLVGDIPQKTQLMTARATPTRRLASVEDVAGAVAYLVSDEAGQVNGETLRVNGGILMA